jgi:hypothetical protein
MNNIYNILPDIGVFQDQTIISHKKGKTDGDPASLDILIEKRK